MIEDIRNFRNAIFANESKKTKDIDDEYFNACLNVLRKFSKDFGFVKYGDIEGIRQVLSDIECLFDSDKKRQNLLELVSLAKNAYENYKKHLQEIGQMLNEHKHQQENCENLENKNDEKEQKQNECDCNENQSEQEQDLKNYCKKENGDKNHQNQSEDDENQESEGKNEQENQANNQNQDETSDKENQKEKENKNQENQTSQNKQEDLKDEIKQKQNECDCNDNQNEQKQQYNCKNLENKTELNKQNLENKNNEKEQENQENPTDKNEQKQDLKNECEKDNVNKNHQNQNEDDGNQESEGKNEQENEQKENSNSKNENEKNQNKPNIRNLANQQKQENQANNQNQDETSDKENQKEKESKNQENQTSQNKQEDLKDEIEQNQNEKEQESKINHNEQNPVNPLSDEELEKIELELSNFLKNLEFLNDKDDESCKDNEDVEKEENKINQDVKISPKKRDLNNFKKQMQEFFSGCDTDKSQDTLEIKHDIVDDIVNEILQELCGVGGAKNILKTPHSYMNESIKKSEIKRLCKMICEGFGIGVSKNDKHNLGYELDGITSSDVLKNALPSEFTLLNDELTENLFFAKFCEKSLSTWLNKSSDKGKISPLIIAIDNSGSMSGAPEMVAKTVGYYLINECKKHKKECILVLATEDGDIKTSKKHGYDELLYALSKYKASGGYNIDEILKASLKKAREHNNKANLLAISDFCIGDVYLKDIQDELNAVKSYALFISFFGGSRFDVVGFHKYFLYDNSNHTINVLERKDKEEKLKKGQR